MTVRHWLLGLMILLGSLVSAPLAAAFDANATFARGTFVISGEGSYGDQFNFEGFNDSDLKTWNVGLRASFLPFGAAGPGVLHGAFEMGLEPLYQRYLEPHSAFWAGLLMVVRYHFLSLGRFVPYVEGGGGFGGSDLNAREIDSNVSFMLWAGVGASVFVTRTTALYAGYRYQHNSNAGLDTPNRGVDTHNAVFGVSYYLRGKR
ncbi:MAG: acyloxyacyl hydrolase [Candidatus Rokuibacteriota bacterium]